MPSAGFLHGRNNVPRSHVTCQTKCVLQMQAVVDQLHNRPDEDRAGRTQPTA